MSAGRADHLLDIFSTELHLVTERKQWKRLAKKIDSLGPAPEHELGETSADVTDDGQFHITIFIRPAAHHSTSNLVATIAHEAAHAAAFIHAHHRVESPGAEDEATAYLVGWIAGWVARHLGDSRLQD